MFVLDVPLDPDVDQARAWLTVELAKPEYAAARPSWFDQLAKSFWDWLASLSPAGTGSVSMLLVIFVAILAAVIIAVLIIFGVPRISRARKKKIAGIIDDTRTAKQLRADAQSAAAAQDWASAVIDAFRALAVGLDERTLVTLTLGTTAQAFAREAQQAFASHSSEIGRAASVFDDIRYLGQPATREHFEFIARTDQALRAAPDREASMPVKQS